MNKFYEKRPVYNALQFDGTVESANDIAAAMQCARWSICNGADNIPQLVIGDMQINLFQWVVRMGVLPVTIIDHQEFKHRFERVPT